MFLLSLPLCKLLPWGKLFLEISGELMSLSSGPCEDLAGGTGAIGQGVPSCWDVLCCPWGLAPAWGLVDPCSSQFKVFLIIISFANGGLVGRMQLGDGAWAGWLRGAHPSPGREPKVKCKLWWVKEEKHTKRLSSGGVLPLSAPREGEQVPLFGGAKSSSGRGERWPWVAGEEPIQDGGRTDAGCFQHDSSAVRDVGPGGGPEPVPRSRGTPAAGAAPPALSPCSSSPGCLFPVPSPEILRGMVSHFVPPSLTFWEDFSCKHLQSHFLQTPLLLRCHQMQGTAQGQGAVVANTSGLCSHQHPGALCSAVWQPCQALVPAEE